MTEKCVMSEGGAGRGKTRLHRPGPREQGWGGAIRILIMLALCRVVVCGTFMLCIIDALCIYFVNRPSPSNIVALFIGTLRIRREQSDCARRGD